MSAYCLRLAPWDYHNVACTSEVALIFCMCMQYVRKQNLKGFKYKNNYVNDKYYLLLNVISSCQADPFLPVKVPHTFQNECL